MHPRIDCTLLHWWRVVAYASSCRPYWKWRCKRSERLHMVLDSSIPPWSLLWFLGGMRCESRGTRLEDRGSKSRLDFEMQTINFVRERMDPLRTSTEQNGWKKGLGHVIFISKTVFVKSPPTFSDRKWVWNDPEVNRGQRSEKSGWGNVVGSEAAGFGSEEEISVFTDGTFFCCYFFLLSCLFDYFSACMC